MKTFSPRFRKALPVLLITAALALSLSAWGLWKYRFFRLEAPLKPLCINELSVSSLATQVGGSTIYEDYIELYNPNNNTISLDGLYLSDTSDYTLAPLPDVTIGPGAHLCIYAAGQDGSVPEGQLSVPFSLSENETVSLTRLEENTAGTASAVLLDTVYIPDSMKIGAVYARTEDGGEIFAQMRPSPGTANQEAALVLEDPTFSQPSDFYEDAVSLQINSSSGTTVHYTLDGSDPTTDSPLYSGSLTLMDPSSHSAMPPALISPKKIADTCHRILRSIRLWCCAPSLLTPPVIPAISLRPPILSTLIRRMGMKMLLCFLS